MNRILKKQLYKIEFSLASPLAIGSGENDLTDKDIVRDSRRKPYIPASSIAGVCRAMLNEEDDIWGKVEGENSIDSLLIFYDGELQNDVTISVRDSVALDEYKTAKPGAKFDMEVVETGARFKTYIEQSFVSEDDDMIAYQISQLFLNKLVKFGGKSSRGYGNICDVSVEGFEVLFQGNATKFDKLKTLSVDTWLDFDIYSNSENDNWTKIDRENVTTKNTHACICLDLDLVGGISIRRYTTDAYDAKSENAKPDFVQLTIKDNIPVIPGTSWAGAFEHNIRKLLGSKYNEEEWINAFGVVNANKGLKKKSKIAFSESQITNSVSKIISRNAIDRFTGGASDGALFTEQTYYGGNTSLFIEFEDQIDEYIAKALAASIVDLHCGLLAVGGETSIGRGQFVIKNVNGKEIIGGSQQELFNAVLSIIPVKEKIDA